MSTPPARQKPLLQDPSAIVAARIDARLSPAELARKAAISLPHLCQAEKGTRGLSAEFLIRIAAEVNRPAADLLNPAYADAGGDPVQLALVRDACDTDTALRADARCARCEKPWSPAHACGQRAKGAAA